ncbi:DNA helicase RecQ [Desulfocurvus sp. DL9XJH121]
MPPSPSPQSPRDILRTVFGFDAFIGLQEAVIDNVLAGRDSLVLMPTGGGKSLCYQIPSLALPGTGVCVSPLIALMQDQVQGLTQMGVRAACLNSSLDPRDAREVTARLVGGDLDLLYVAPERLCRPEFLDLLARCKPCLFAIDEAHCVSQWGHDFRPEYTQLSIIAEHFPGVPRLALTATADKPTQGDILNSLELQGAQTFATGFDRPNISYTVRPKHEPLRMLTRFIRENHEGDAGIVYRLSRANVEKTAAHLVKEGFNALPYHAGLAKGVRQENQERFMREEGVIMVATVAFGMGVDKPNVRFVCHLEPPKSLEAYHQETGRAGRDGLPATAWMCYGLQDMAVLRSMIDSGEADEDRKRIEHHKLNALFAFLETAGCRRQSLLAYFGERREPCGNCDNCLHPVATWDGTVAAQKALSNIYRTGQRFGAGHLAAVLTGRTDERILRFGHDQVSTHGIGTELNLEEWKSVYRQLAGAGLLSVDMERWGALTLNEDSWAVLRGEREVRLRTDPTLPRAASAKRGKAAAAAPEDAEARALFDALRELRLSISKERSVPPYAIFPDRTLMEMVRYRPEDLDGLGLLSGVGRVKLQRFGQAFVDALAAYAAEHGRPADLAEIPRERRAARERAEARESEGLSATQEASLALFGEHGDVEAVARERGLKEGTVWNHLLCAVRQGRLAPDDLLRLSPKDDEAVRQAFETCRAQGAVGLTPVHEALGGRFSYELLRAVASCGADRP